MNGDDPNNAANSVFDMGAMSSLNVNDTVTGSDGSILTITALDTNSGRGSFSVDRLYTDDGDSTGNVGTATATFNLAGGETVTVPLTMM